jgi:hypothetical protein
MNQNDQPDGELEPIDVVVERPVTEQGTYGYKRSDGTVVRGDASGEWSLDDEGEVGEIVFFISPSWTRRGQEG